MSFRERMAVGTSQAEDFVHAELQNRGDGHRIERNKIMVLFEDGTYAVVDSLTEKQIQRLRELNIPYTAPDLLIDYEKPVYLDGPPHKKRGVKNRDDKIDAALRKCGITPHRYSFKSSQQRRRLLEICDEIEKILEETA